MIFNVHICTLMYRFVLFQMGNKKNKIESLNYLLTLVYIRGTKIMWVIEGIREVLKSKKRDREIMAFLERRIEDLKNVNLRKKDKY